MSERYVAIDLGGTQIRLALSDRECRLSGVQKRAVDHSGGPPGIMEQLGRMLEAALAETGVAREDLVRAVIASPGPLDTSTGIVYGAPNMPGWEGEVPLQAMLSERLGLQVRAVNDANVAAVGEYNGGVGRGTRNMVYLTVSTGIGGGVIVEGALLEGSRGMAGEIGHMTLDMNGPICKCGNVGCLEMLASGTSIARRFREALAAGGESPLADLGRPATAADVSRAAVEADPLARAVWDECMRALGFGVVNCIHIFNPHVVVLGGGVTNAGDALFEPVREIADRYALELPRKGVRIERAQLRDDTGLYGAAVLAVVGQTG